tara:strand:- start:5506 stop:5679 length:174 start_codon:yes stop_codon:yes gene_type:complete
MTALAEQISEQMYRPCPAGESKSVWRAMEELRLQNEGQQKTQEKVQNGKKKGRPAKV